MADNFSVTPGSGVDIRAVEKSAKKAQTITVDIGGAGAEKLLTAGQQLAADSIPVTLTELEQDLIGELDETAPATDTASSGLNGRLQRIAQNLTSYLGANSGAAVVTDVAGTIQQYLRGVISFFANWNESNRVKVNVQDVSGLMIENAVAVTVKRTALGFATSGDNTLLSGVAGKKIRVLSMMLISGGTVNLYFTSNAAGTVIFGGSTNKIALAANTGFVLPYNPHGWMEVTTDGHALVANLSAAIAVSGGMTYIEAE